MEQADLKLGDSVAVFAQGPVGLCAILGARLLGAAEVIAIDEDPGRLAVATQYGATVALLAGEDPAGKIQTITFNRGVDVVCVDLSNDALDVKETFESALRALRPGGTLSSVGDYRGHLKVTRDVCGATLCPGGKERMARLMRLVRCHRVDLSPLITHLFTLDEIVEAYELVESRQIGVLKVGIRVS